MKCEICGEERGVFLENRRCYSCRRKHYEATRPIMLWDLLDVETKKKLIR